MTIDVLELITKKRIKKEIELSYDEENFFDGSEKINFLSKVNLKGDLSILDNIISLSCTLKADLELTCSRCLDKFKYPLELKIEEKFTNNPDNVDEEIFFIEGESIELTPIIQNNIMLALPIKRLCKHNCKGLCPKCGSNLNIADCGCDKLDIDPRLAQLKDFFRAD